VRDVNRLNWALIVLGALMVLLEVVLGAISGFDLLLLGSAVLLGGVIGLVTGSAAVGVATAGILALLYLFVGRRRVRGRLNRPSIPSNTDALLGRNVRVVERITADHPGRVKFEGEEWRAHVEGPLHDPIEPGETVRVSRIDGVTMFVARTPAAPPGSAAH
jgi:membrane protein implicated in regulation of membrane protease activity